MSSLFSSRPPTHSNAPAFKCRFTGVVVRYSELSRITRLNQQISIAAPTVSFELYFVCTCIEARVRHYLLEYLVTD